MEQGVDIPTLAIELGESRAKVKGLIDVYSFMIDHNESSIDRWSYYEEYLKNRAIKGARKENPTMDGIVVSKIRSGEISRAIDIRDKLAPISRAGGKPLALFLRKEDSFDDASEMTADRSDLYNRLNRFKKAIAPVASSDVSLSDEQKKKCLYETRQIAKILKSLEGKLAQNR